MNKILLVVVAASILIGSCKKTQDEGRAMSSFSIVNATTDVATMRAYAGENNIPWKIVPTTFSAGQYLFTHLGVWAGVNSIKSVSAADTTISLFRSSKPETFEQGRANTFFICGNTATGYEGILLSNESFVKHTDSVIGIRFINLSSNSTPVNITLSATPGINEATGLVYKQQTNFKTYPALQTTGNMVFQVRDAAGALLASYTFPVTAVSPYTTVGIPSARFKNITLVIKGLQGTTSGTSAFGMFPVAHY